MAVIEERKTKDGQTRYRVKIRLKRVSSTDRDSSSPGGREKMGSRDRGSDS